MQVVTFAVLFSTLYRAMLFGGVRTALQRGRKAASLLLGKPSNPVGDANGKTDLPGSYRTVGPSCPPCALADACYAKRGRTGIAQRRAHMDALRSVAAAFMAMLQASLDSVWARLHVSGDFGNGRGGIQASYVEGVALGAEYVRKREKRTGPIAFTYTHFTPEKFDTYRERLRVAGVEVLYSDPQELQAGSAIAVVDVSKARARIHAAGLNALLCPAQQSKALTCRRCIKTTGGCLEARDRNRVVIFVPEKGTNRLVGEAQTE